MIGTVSSRRLHRTRARVVMLCSAGILAGAAATPVLAQTAPSVTRTTAAALAPEAETEFQFDPSKYAYLSVQLMAQDAKIFDGACPKSGSILGLDFSDIMLGSGKREAKITVEIEMPSLTGTPLPTIKLDPLTISISKPFLGAHECKVALEAFDFSSPLFFMGAYKGQNFTVRTRLYRKKDGIGKFFADSLDGAVAIVKSVSSVPVDAVVQIDAIGKLVRNAGVTQDETSSAVELKLAGPEANPTIQKDWPLATGVTGFPGEISVKVRLRSVDTLFYKQGAEWTPGDVMQTPFSAKGVAGNIQTFLMDTKIAASAYNRFTGTSTIETVATPCEELMEKVDAIGLSSRDRAILKWALIRGHPTLRSNPAIDHLKCVDGVFGLLPTETTGSTVTPKEFVLRPIPDDTPKPVLRDPTVVEMSSAVEGSQRLAKFLKAQTREQRRTYGPRLFANPHTYLDADGIGVLDGVSLPMTSASDWIANQWDANRALATKVGCYSWSTPGSDIAPGSMLALALFITGSDGTGRREALVRITFAKLADIGPGEAKIEKFEIIASPDSAAIKAIKARNGSRCGDDDEWAPELLK